jgi:transposase
MSDFLPYSIDQPYLMPLDLREWLPKDDIAYFVSDVVDGLDLSGILYRYAGYERRGRRSYNPLMMTKLLVYGYVTGTFSSRRIEAATHRSLDFRILSGDQHPDHDSICAFRKAHLSELAGLFVQVLKLCDEAGLVGTGPICVDGTKILANASIRANRTAKSLADEQSRIDEHYARHAQAMLDLADKIDAEEDAKFGKGNRGDRVPAALTDRKTRAAFIKEALAAMKRQAAEKAAKSDEPGAEQENSTQDASNKVNVTDPDSRIMRDGATKAYVQAYNAQAVVDTKNQVVIAAEITQDANDKQQLVPMLEKAIGNVGRRPAQALADAGYYSEQQVTDAKLEGIELLVPPDKACTAAEVDENALSRLEEEVVIVTSDGHRFVRYTEPPTAADTMRAKLTTPAGRSAYAKRAQTVEPIFGQIKQGSGFRRFLLRGKQNVAQEWKLVCLASNLKKLFRSQSMRRTVNTTLPKPSSQRTCVQTGIQLAMNVA